jgi:hypothetical protein
LHPTAFSCKPAWLSLANQKPEPAHALEHDKSFLYHGLDASFRGVVTGLEGQVASANRLISA